MEEKNIKKRAFLTNVLGYPRIGANRELKKSLELFWQGKIDKQQLLEAGRQQRLGNWQQLQKAGIDLIPSNDFSFYDQMLDMSLMLGAIPERYRHLEGDKFALYFAMAHGMQQQGQDVIAMEMTKWFDTNYHYIVPEFTSDQTFRLFDNKATQEFVEAKNLGLITKPVLIGPVTYLLLGKEKTDGFHRIELLDRLLPVYVQLLQELESQGAEWVQIDEPCLVTDLDNSVKEAYRKAYDYIASHVHLKIILTTYFGSLDDNADLAISLPVDALHIDVAYRSEQVSIAEKLPRQMTLSLGVVNGRNIWRNDLESSLQIIRKATAHLSPEQVILSTSCSLLHVPYDLETESNEQVLPSRIKRYMAFARQKVGELSTLQQLLSATRAEELQSKLALNRELQAKRHQETDIHQEQVVGRVAALKPSDYNRESNYNDRASQQRAILRLPLWPTTTIGSFPQTKEVRRWRSDYRKGNIAHDTYVSLIKQEIRRCIAWQENVGLDVLVHGEFERNDMVEYFGEKLNGFTFTQNGWVQSYGSRCVKPPIIFGDVSRKSPMTVEWTKYAQSLTSRPVKGMLTGPVTILEWSFVRDDQPREDTCRQIALAIRDEVVDIESAGIQIIQIDEPALREGLPLRRSQWDAHLKWAVDCFRLSASGVKDTTQIHTHMCYSEFNDIIEHIARMDADVITIECSRSQMDLLDVFHDFDYPNEIGPGVYDIHSARVPSVEEMTRLLQKAQTFIPVERLWVNPDCGLKTRGWEETRHALENMIEAAKQMRAAVEASGVTSDRV
ncbi:MAG: 5-methyltetrahydropteroyltriglutamate--homocysteine S-methyltransferase [Prevotella sp.]|nr:5-methyltetrahydropteroyltriglutamate--homocysteine S-methyltransferase [Prevotella sp.]